MTTSASRFRCSVLFAVRAVPAGLLLLVACGPSLPRLEKGVPVERELRGGQIHEYRLELASDSYARLEVDQPGVDVAADLYGPTGKKVAGTAGPAGIGEDETVSLVTERRGGYRLVVTPRDPEAPPGRYRLLLEELRPAAATDGRRAAAERLMEEGRRYSRVTATAPLAIGRYSAALRLWRAIGDVRGEVDTLNLLAPTYAADSAQAIATSRLALRRARQVSYREGEAMALKNLGTTLANEKRFDEALASLQGAFELWRAAGDRSGQHTALQNMGQVHLNCGQPAPALAAYQRSLELATSLSERANALGGIGVSQYAMGRFETALDTLWEVSSLHRQNRDGDNLGRTLGLIATIHQQRGHIEEARRISDQGLQGARAPDARAYLLYLRANLLLELGDLEQALANYEEALGLYNRLGERGWEDTCRSGIAWVRLHQGDPGGALAEYEQIESGEFDYQRGLVFWALKEPARAAGLLEKALERARRANDRTSEGEIQLALGNAYRELGRTSAAAASLTRAEELGRRIPYPGVLAPSLFRLAQLDRDQGRLEKARNLAREALGIIESLRSRVTERELGTFFFASRRAYYELYVDVLLRLDQLRPRHGYREDALAASEEARARVLLDLLAESRIARERRSPGETRQATAGADLRARPPAPLGLGEIRALLDEDTALLEYTLGAERSTLFVVTRERLEAFALPPMLEVKRRVDHFRKLLRLSSGPRRNDYTGTAHRLYLDLVAPAAGALAGKSRLVVAPDRSLYMLPFEALLTAPAMSRPAGELPFLIQSYSVSYVPSASVLARLRKPMPRLAVVPAATGRRFIAFADPPLQTSRNAAGLRPLPGARSEVDEIARLYGPQSSKLYVGAEATEDAVKNNTLVATTEYLHFATHGRLEEKHPGRSGLLLAEEPGSREDGFLQAFEVFDLQLSADLVVLSACDSGGKEVTGEGLVGLTRAFLYAGAPSLAVSLWKVSDKSTAPLMVRFYDELSRTGDKAEALRRSKRAMIEDPKLAHPFHWASFILVGDPGREP